MCCGEDEDIRFLDIFLARSAIPLHVACIMPSPICHKLVGDGVPNVEECMHARGPVVSNGQVRGDVSQPLDGA